MEQRAVDGLLSAVDNPGFLWYLPNQHSLLLYYLLTRSGGCKDKLCGLFLRAEDVPALGRPARTKRSKAIPTRGRQQCQRNKEQRSGSMLRRVTGSSSARPEKMV